MKDDKYKLLEESEKKLQKAEEMIVESERKYRQLFEKSRDGYAMVDMKGKIIECNPAFEKITGYKLKELKKKTLRTITPKKYLKKEEKILKNQVMKRGYSDPYEKEYQRKDGTYVPVELRRYLIKDEKGKKTVMWAIVTDVTKRKKIEEERKLYARGFEESPTSIMITDSQGHIIAVNQQFTKLYGFKEKEALGKTPKLVSTGKKPTKYYKDMFKNLTNPEIGSWQDEIENKKKNGDSIYVLQRVICIFDKNKKPESYIANHVDITEKKKIEEELKLFSEGFESSPTSIMITNAKGEIIAVNQQFTDTYGYKEKEALGKQPNIISAGTYDKKFYKKMWSDLLNPKKGVWKGEMKNKSKKGKEIWALLSIKTIFDKGKPIYFIANHKDVTERKEYQEKVRKAEAKYRTLTEVSPDCIKVFDLEGNLNFINESGMEEHNLKDLKQAKKYNFKQSMTKESAKKFRDALKKAKEGKTTTFEIEHTFKGDKPRYCLETITPVLDKDGNVVQSFGVSRDISKLKAVMKEMRSLKEIDKLKSEFLNLISHNLKTPLTPIKAQLQLCDEGYLGELNDEQKKSLKMIQENLYSLERLINNLLSISRIQGKELELNVKTHNPEKIIKEIIQHKESQLNAKKISLKTDLKCKKAKFDKDKISVVIQNLLENAIKFTKKGGKISVKCRIDKKTLKISVKDNGIGIKKSAIKNLFQAFTKESWKTAVKYRGGGLGLAICKSFIDAHGGKIWVESKKGKGSEFKIEIPQNRLS